MEISPQLQGLSVKLQLVKEKWTSFISIETKVRENLVTFFSGKKRILTKVGQLCFVLSSDMIGLSASNQISYFRLPPPP